MTCGVNVFIVRLEHPILHLECINPKKKAQWVVWDGSKIICTVLLRERAIDTIDILHEVQTRWKGFSSVSLLLRHFQATGARKRSDKMGRPRWEGGILNYELVFGECFPFDIIGDIPAWPRKNGNYGKKLLPTRIQNLTRNFCELFVLWVLHRPFC